MCMQLLGSQRVTVFNHSQVTYFQIMFIQHAEDKENFNSTSDLSYTNYGTGNTSKSCQVVKSVSETPMCMF